MKDILIANGWVHYRTGCSCNGSPHFYKHDDHLEEIVVRNSRFSIYKEGKPIETKGDPKNPNQLLKKYDLIQDSTEDKNLEA